MKTRLYSLDILRGVDIFFLTVVSSLLYSIDDVWSLPVGFMRQLGHPDWVGFTVLDMVMPLFIFMCGAALPLALPKRLGADDRLRLRRRGVCDPHPPQVGCMEAPRPGVVAVRMFAVIECG